MTTPLEDLSTVRLLGCRCAACGETSLGRKSICPNCGGGRVSEVALADHGSLWTYTVVRHRPPGNYRGPDPFVPFGIGLVELPDGLRVMAPLAGSPDRLRIGMPVRFQPVLRRDDDREVVAFCFEPDETGAAHG